MLVASGSLVVGSELTNLPDTASWCRRYGTAKRRRRGRREKNNEYLSEGRLVTKWVNRFLYCVKGEVFVCS